VLTDFITEGHFARHLRRMRLLYRDRRSALVDSLRGELGSALNVLGSQAGMHLVATLAKGSRDRTLSKRAAEQGIWTIPLSSCYLGKAHRQGLVLGYGSSSAAELRDAVGRLRGVLESGELRAPRRYS
jgi:GntR family transcriptional regulator/MocR family aminotransferase